MSGGLSFARLRALAIKEFIQVMRDRLTFAMIIAIPILQLILFGFALNSDPHDLPVAVISADNSQFSRSIVAALRESAYFKFVAEPPDEETADGMIARGDVQFLIQIPPDFGRDIVRGRQPAMLVVADATDPTATANALAAVGVIEQRALEHDLVGPLARLAVGPRPFDMRVHHRYNPEGLTEFNVVPGVIGTILTMTLVMLTAIAMTRERERGTMESLLATTARPFEVMVAKILPYIVIGYLQVAVILILATFLFGVPVVGSVWLLSAALIVFIAANLSMGFTFSTLARSQLQAMQMGVFFFLPSMLLSGFVFPFRGMPIWAQWLGELLPLTHALRIIRGILLKGNGIDEIVPDLWPMLLFMLTVGTLAMLRYRRTLD